MYSAQVSESMVLSRCACKSGSVIHAPPRRHFSSSRFVKILSIFLCAAKYISGMSSSSSLSAKLKGLRSLSGRGRSLRFSWAYSNRGSTLSSLRPGLLYDFRFSVSRFCRSDTTDALRLIWSFGLVAGGWLNGCMEANHRQGALFRRAKLLVLLEPTFGDKAFSTASAGESSCLIK